jgi:hypothetical protein
VPVLREDHPPEFLHQAIHHGQSRFGTRHGERPAGAEVVLEINDDEDDVSVLTTKTRADNQPEAVVGRRAAPGSNLVVGPAAAPNDTETASGGSSDPTSAGPAGGAVGGPVGK